MLSGFGILLMILSSIAVLQPKGIFVPVVIAWITALWAHHRMSLAWIDDRPLGKGFSVVAFVLGILGLIALPFAEIVVAHKRSDAPQAFFVVALELLVMCPAVGLAAYLNWYHASPELQSESIAERSSNADV